MKVIQINLNHCAAAQDLLSQTVREHGTDLAVLSEPYRGGRNHNWAVDSSGKAALWVCGTASLRLENVHADNGFVRAKAGGWWVYSTYLAPSLTLAEFAAILDRLAADARGRSPTLLAGDFNAWAVDWGSVTTNARGRTLLEALSTLDVALLNVGQEHTFSRAGAGSVVDLTFASRSRAGQCRWILSGHAPSTSPAQQRKSFKADLLDTQAFALRMQSVEASGDSDVMASSVMGQVLSACEECIPSRSAHSRHRASVYWWNQEIAEARMECVRARRLYQRSRGSQSHLVKREAYHRCRRALKAAIKGSKRKCFLELCEAADRDPWGERLQINCKESRQSEQLRPTGRGKPREDSCAPIPQDV
nr:uncharacterized protein LOC121501845 [Drosophila kikkawai]